MPRSIKDQEFTNTCPKRIIVRNTCPIRDQNETNVMITAELLTQVKPNSCPRISTKQLAHFLNQYSIAHEIDSQNFCVLHGGHAASMLKSDAHKIAQAIVTIRTNDQPVHCFFSDLVDSVFLLESNCKRFVIHP